MTNWRQFKNPRPCSSTECVAAVLKQIGRSPTYDMTSVTSLRHTCIVGL